MTKSADAFRSIGEVSQLIGVAPHVLRYWETQFPLFAPVKRRDGRRYYRPDDVRLAAGLCEVLREDGMTIRGAKKQMAADRGAALRARGAARLGQADETPAPAATKPAKPRRPRKAEAEPLPLFPELPLGDPLTAGSEIAAQADALVMAVEGSTEGTETAEEDSLPAGTDAAAAQERGLDESAAAETVSGRGNSHGIAAEALDGMAEAPSEQRPLAKIEPSPAPADTRPAEWLDRLRALALAVRAQTAPLPPQATSLARELQRARAALA